MRLRSHKITVIATVVCLFNLQRLISQITLQNLMFLRERMMEDFVQESESLVFLTAVLLSVHRRRGNFRHIRRCNASITSAECSLETKLSNGT